MTNNYIDKIGYVLIKDRKLLLSWETGKTAWILPGGKREAGETDLEALKRELKEELNVELIPESAKFFEVFEGQAHGKPEGVMVRIICYQGDYIDEFKPQPPVERIGWVTSKEKKLSIPGKKLIKYLKEKDLID